jgi:drug/metabolite transporter (DMT)-like permease
LSTVSRPEAAPDARRSLSGLIYVVVAVGIFSTSSVTVRLAAPVAPEAISFGRLLIAAVVILVAARWLRRKSACPASFPLTRRTLPRFALYGLFAAGHFLLFIASLSYTTIAHTLAIVYTSPVFVTLFAAVALREPLRSRQWLGLPVVMGGIAVLAGFEPRMDARMAVGDLMALGSAVCYGLYSIAGRRERDTFSLFDYAGLVYLFAALWLAPAAIATWRGGLTLQTGLAIAYQGFGPLAIGHTLYNASVRRVHPTYVNLVSTQEVTGGILLGALLLGEIPDPSALIGVAVSLIGVALVLLL